MVPPIASMYALQIDRPSPGPSVKVFEELPDACRKVYLRSLEGKSHQEISEELNIAINTIKKHKNNANHYLRVRLEKLLCFITWIG